MEFDPTFNYRERLAVPPQSPQLAIIRSPYYEDITIGLVLQLQKPPITRLLIARFAGATGDFNPSHVDEDVARDIGGMNGVFAHGMLGMGFMGQVLTDFLGIRKLRMFAARAVLIVRPGDVLTSVARVTKKWVEDEDNIVSFQLTATNQDGKVTHTGEAEAVVPHRPVQIQETLKRPELVRFRVIG